MTEHRLRNAIGLFIILSHFGIIAAMLLAPYYGMHFHQGADLASVAAPLFAAYTTAIIKRIIRDKNTVEDTSPKVSTTFIILSFLMPTFLTLGVVYVLFAYVQGFIEDFPMVKKTILALQTMIGVYVGFLIDALFGDADRAAKAKARAEKKQKQAARGRNSGRV